MPLSANKKVKAESLFDFDPAEHDVLSTKLGSYVQTRLNSTVPSSRYALYDKNVSYNTRLVNHLAGWYWLDHCLSSGAIEGRRREKAVMLYETQTSAIAEFMSEYIMAICAGELRHGVSRCSWEKSNGKVCDFCSKFFINLRGKHPNGTDRSDGSQFFFEQVKKGSDPTYGHMWGLLIHGFTDHSWGGGGLGGPRWGYIAYMGRCLWTAWAEGDLNAMATYIDYVIHAVHNGCNCLYDKFTWFTCGKVEALGIILNAKFFGKPCCWESISPFIPEMYRLVKPPEGAIKSSVSAYELESFHVSKGCKDIVAKPRDISKLPEEESLYASFFEVKDLCTVCGQTAGSNGSCAKQCDTCKTCVGIDKWHSHMCAMCNAPKAPGTWNDPKCPNFCQMCFDAQTAELKKVGYTLEDDEAYVYNRGCHTIAQKSIYNFVKMDHMFIPQVCHQCGTLHNKITPSALYGHTICPNHPYAEWGKFMKCANGKCDFCVQEQTAGLWKELPADATTKSVSGGPNLHAPMELYAPLDSPVKPVETGWGPGAVAGQNQGNYTYKWVEDNLEGPETEEAQDLAEEALNAKGVISAAAEDLEKSKAQKALMASIAKGTRAQSACECPTCSSLRSIGLTVRFMTTLLGSPLYGPPYKNNKKQPIKALAKMIPSHYKSA